MTRNRHSREFQDQALIKVRARGGRSVRAIAAEINMSEGTLRKWIGNSNRKAGQSTPTEALPSDVAAQSWSPAQRLLALHATHGLAGPELHAWCREKGLFEHQLKAWNEAFCNPVGSEAREFKASLRELQAKHDGLQRELTRKEKALAEAAALLVLQKKYQALWEGEEK